MIPIVRSSLLMSLCSKVLTSSGSSVRLKLSHGFPERGGGVSTGSFSSLNFSTNRGDSPDNIAQNQQRLARQEGFAVEQLRTIQHDHGTEIRVIDSTTDSPGVEERFDGIVTAVSGITLGTFGADCVPLLFVDPRTKVVGAAHAGWRGTSQRMAFHMVGAMQALGCQPQDILVAVGPCIGVANYEVGDEVTEVFRSAFGDVSGILVRGQKKWHVNLATATRYSLLQAGVLPEHIDCDPPDTFADATRFYSYRRDGNRAGTHMSFIGLL